MAKTVYIWGEAERFSNYRRWVESAGGRAVSGSAAAGQGALWDALLLPGGGDLEPWRYGQENTASRGLEPERDGAEQLKSFRERWIPLEEKYFSAFQVEDRCDYQLEA